MADRYLLESGAPDGYLLEDGSGVYLLNNGVVWDTAASHADYTINDTGLIATKAANAVNGSQAQSNTVMTTGYFEVKAAPFAPAVGLVPSGAANNNWVGFVANSIGYHSGGTVYRNNVNFATYAAFGTTDTVMCALKLVTATLYVFFGVNGVWQTGTDPSAGTGGIDVTALFASAVPAISANNVNDATTGHFTAADLTYAIPTGLTAWDGTTSSTVFIAVGLCLETDTALALGVKEILATGLCTETDTAFNLRIAMPVGLSTATNTALGLGIALGIGRSAETDAGLALGGVLVKAVGLSTETDSSLALAAVLRSVVGLTTETDTALGLGIAQKVGLSIETDTALALAAKLVSAVGLASEADTSFNFALALGLGLSAETDSVLARPAVLVSSTGISLESNLALALGLAQKVGLSTELDTSYALTPIETGMVSFAVEVDTCFALTARLIGPVGRSDETDLALRLRPFHASAGDSRFISSFAKSFIR